MTSFQPFLQLSVEKKEDNTENLFQSNKTSIKIKYEKYVSADLVSESFLPVNLKTWIKSLLSQRQSSATRLSCRKVPRLISNNFYVLPI